MALTRDQRAVLQLLLERGQSYADLSALLEVDEAEVRERARSALRELAGTDPDRSVALTDYLLRQADPIGRADAVRHLRENPDDHRLAAELAAELREAFPTAELPRLPGEPRPARRRLPRPGARTAEERAPAAEAVTERLTSRQGRIVVLLGSGAILLIAVVLGIAGAFGGEDDDSGTPTSAATATDSASGTPAGDELTRVELTPPRGGNATGNAAFGLTSSDQAYVELGIEGLDPPPQAETYVLWLMLTPDQGYPLAPIAVNERGTFRDRFPIPAPVLPIVSRVRTVDISLAPVRAVDREIRRALAGTKLVLEKPGRTVLAGDVPATVPSESEG